MEPDLAVAKAETTQETFYHHLFLWDIFGTSRENLQRCYARNMHELQEGLFERFNACPSSDLHISQNYWASPFEVGVRENDIRLAQGSMESYPAEVMDFLREYYSAVGGRLIIKLLQPQTGGMSKLAALFPEVDGLVKRLINAFGLGATMDNAARKITHAGDNPQFDLMGELRRREWGIVWENQGK